MPNHFLFNCRFAVNFITSVSDLYFKEIGCDIATPPDSLIELFTEWISENPNLCSETQPPLDLPSGAIPMALISPIEGLIRWCALSPLFLPLNDLIYSKLHLAVLQSLTQVSKIFSKMCFVAAGKNSADNCILRKYLFAVI